MSWSDALRSIEIPEENMSGRCCVCPENPNVDEYGDNSWLPCMGFEPDNNLSCNRCIYCQKIPSQETP